MANKNLITQDGYDKLILELEERKTKTRESIANEIENARAQGDLSENAAYTAALNSKEFNETRITEVEELISNSEIIGNNSGNNFVEMGEEFILIQADTNKKLKYKLVGVNEANPQDGKISSDSPIGGAVLGKKYGSDVEISLPSGVIKFKIEKS
ncbi:transcription elongation factor GreA [Candidatus Dojkabacteria bacterium]|nr:transcription elongation factor GreA [Candidatus Dojkabacteria bacterium]